MTYKPVPRHEIEHLLAAAHVTSKPTLAIGTEVVEQIIDEILALRGAVDDAIAVLGGEDKDYDEWAALLGRLRAIRDAQ